MTTKEIKNLTYQSMKKIIATKLTGSSSFFIQTPTQILCYDCDTDQSKIYYSISSEIPFICASGISCYMLGKLNSSKNY